jgi:two-component system, LytTR family, sensor kinase
MKNRSLVYWLCQLVGWGIYTAIGIWAAVQQVGASPRLFINYAVFFAVILLLTHLLRREIRRRQWLRLPMRKAVPRLAGATALVAFCSTAQVIGLDEATGGGLWTWIAFISIQVTLLGACATWTVIYVTVQRDRIARASEIATAQLTTEMREAQLRALEAQLNPHFLFNSLNTIRGMIVENAAVAQDMVTRLANILRYNLEREKTSTVPLEREIEIVADFLAIESIRFDDRLRVRMEIQPAAAQAQVPSMLVQTLVENAIKHGIGSRAEGGEIVIRASVRNGALAMEVVNSGQLSAPVQGATQIGLTNARERLRLLYGERATLRLENRDAVTVAAMVSIPA